MILLQYKDMFWGPGGDNFNLWILGYTLQPIIWVCIRHIFDINVNSNATSLGNVCCGMDEKTNKKPNSNKGHFVDFLFLPMGCLGEGARLPTQQAAHTHCARQRPTSPRGGRSAQNRDGGGPALFPWRDSQRPPLSWLVALTKLGQGKSK